MQDLCHMRFRAVCTSEIILKRLRSPNLVHYFMNSVAVALCTLLGIVVLSAPAAYAISKIQFKQNEKVLTFSCSV